MEPQSRRLAEQLKALPDQPGVYLMKDAAGKVIYVGKAANLKHRVRSYFGAPTGHSPKTVKLVERIADFEYIVTDTEIESLILESNLIKRYKPHYNVRLKDDKQYPYLRIDLKEDFPRVEVVRRQSKDGARYFGPFANSSSVRSTLDLLNKLFPYRTCDRVITGNDPRPCLEYFIKRCGGPCIGAVTKEEYHRVIEQVVLFLEGKQEAVVRDLEKRMEEAAENLEFERAAILRDQIRAVEKVIERQKISSTSQADEDVIGFARDEGEVCVLVFFVRTGKLIGREHFILEGAGDEDPPAILASFVKQFYSSAAEIPRRIHLQAAPEDQPVLDAWLSSQRGSKVTLSVPQRGEKRDLVDLVAENAAHVLQQRRVRWMADRGATQQALEELQEELVLPSLPRRIECYDISNTQGTSSVGSMVVFEEGQPKKADYRRFKIKTVEGANDFASLQEVLRRRFRRGLVGEEADGRNAAAAGSWASEPNLIIIDGGKGQLSAVMEVVRELGLDHIPVVGLAKQLEEIFKPNQSEPALLPRHSQSLYLVQRIRDEAHRFAITYHRSLRDRQMTQSILNEVPGIGPRRKQTLIRHFGSLERVREASVDELLQVPGITRSLASKIKQYL
ncbi:MAG TPA: excinuclease ABC subunit UvrC [Dehalococcoidia bacterium]|nr:excinuclease ABC subunit UvrC [Dehalococcoidia bacterium]